MNLNLILVIGFSPLKFTPADNPPPPNLLKKDPGEFANLEGNGDFII